MHEKIHQLIQSGRHENILMALQLREVLDRPLDLSPYEELARFIHREFKLRYDIRSTKELLFFLTDFKRLELRNSMNPDKVAMHPTQKALPKNFHLLVNLEVLKLEEDYKIEEIPASIGRLRHLRELEIYNSPITQLPDEITQLQKLQKLIIHKGQLTKLPEELGGWERLEELHLRSNQVQAIPPSVGELKKLKFLNLGDNTQLKTLPDRIFDLQQLEFLVLPCPVDQFSMTSILRKKLPNTTLSQV